MLGIADAASNSGSPSISATVVPKIKPSIHKGLVMYFLLSDVCVVCTVKYLD